MTVFFNDSNVNNGVLNISTGSQPYEADITVPVTVNVGKSGTGVINLGDGNDIINYNNAAGATINMGAGNDYFNMQAKTTALINFTGGAGNDTVWLQPGAHMIANYSFTLQGTALVSNDGADTLTGKGAGKELNGAGWVPGTDVLDFHTGGVVNANNFSQYFNVNPNAPGPNGSTGTLITDKSGDGFSILLVGVHDTAAQLIAAHAFTFA
jgi:hypothetical protein